MMRTLTSVVSNILSLIVVVAVAYVWLVIPYLVQGDKLLATTGEQTRAAWLQNYTELTRLLTRSLQFSGGLEVTALYATAEYCELIKAVPVDNLQPDTHFVFIVEERAQHGNLPQGQPGIVLVIDGQVYQPALTESEEAAGLQRKIILQFRKNDDNNQSLLRSDSGKLTLQLTDPRGRYQVGASERDNLDTGWIWNLPLTKPTHLQAERATGTLMLFSLAAGLLSSTLTPCLLQLGLLFLATLGGVSIAAVTDTGAVTGVVRRRLIWSVTLLVVGFIALFAISGAWIGLAGKQAQLVYTETYRYAGVMAGIAVILFGL